ncbi:hypothetical protein HB991_17330 [Yersinia mollaretii]|uniref:CbrC family protein n=1 Tax=Yersinia mollaretii TaxID=33060 RepID=A0AA44CNW7_YERMO|nr:CbrC family protein [Yersinia mollaretii]NIL24263.1 hypothetical protein [Yersinia mollaretii]CNJ22051.1 Uncharacterised protein family (UPF0167) [Yersinia mollaretii]CQR09407.1 Uncharacterised protein family (UPF0167) [Yersinia mollaretii]
MEKTLPHFIYVSDEYAREIFTKGTVKCDCCEKMSDYSYIGPIHMPGTADPILCPWCIHDGSAAKKYQASFNELYDGELAASIHTIVREQTPGYCTWQDLSWATHCHDACVYHGDATTEDVALASEQTRKQWMNDYAMREEDWSHFMKDHQPHSDQGVYKFICRHCNLVIFNWDFS